MYEKKRTVNGRASKPPSFKVWMYHDDDRVEGKRCFDDLAEANLYFKELCAIRTSSPAAVIATCGHDVKKYFRIDRICVVKRMLLDLDWMPASPNVCWPAP